MGMPTACCSRPRDAEGGGPGNVSGRYGKRRRPMNPMESQWPGYLPLQEITVT